MTDKSTRLISINEVVNKVGGSKSWIYSLIRSGDFPRSVPLGPRKVAWLESEVDEWIQQRVTKRNTMTDTSRSSLHFF